MQPKRFPYLQMQNQLGESGFFPLLPIYLTSNSKTIQVLGLLDSGSTVNVLPYQIGIDLGLVREEYQIPISLTGNLSSVKAKAILLEGKVDEFPVRRLAFGWTKSDNIPLLLGQTNFFMEFNVFFFRSQLAFEVCPK